MFFFCVDFLDSCRASTLLAELDDDEDLPEPDEEDDENEDDNQEDQEYEEVMVLYRAVYFYSTVVSVAFLDYFKNFLNLLNMSDSPDSLSNTVYTN